jgi:hypothetical protein
LGRNTLFTISGRNYCGRERVDDLVGNWSVFLQEEK